MKKYLYIIVFTIYASLITPLHAVEIASDIDSEYETPWNLSKENFPTAAIRVGTDIFNMYKYFDEKYPGTQLEEDFSEEVARLYPQLNYKEVRKREQNIRFVIGLYRNGKKLYNDIKSKILTPKDPPLIVDDKDFDDGTFPEYIPSEEALIITDFKKVLSYGNDPRDFQAQKGKYQRENANFQSDDIFWQLQNTISKLSFSKLLDYGYTLPNPFSGNLGIGPWAGESPVEARITTAQTAFDNSGKIEGIIDFHLEHGQFLLLHPTKDYKAPQIDFSQSKNLKDYKISWVMPQRIYLSKRLEDFVGYTGKFPLPITFEVEDTSAPLFLKSNITATICDDKNCNTQTVSPSLQILPSPTPKQTDTEIYIKSAFKYIPSTNNDDNIKLISAVIEKNEFDEPLLRIKYKTDINPAKFNIFIFNNENIIFGSPKTAVRDDIITINIPVLTPNIKLEGKEFLVYAGSKTNSIQQIVKIKNPSIFDKEARSITLGIILIAIIGGFLLNLMPCVFPVLSLKLMSILQFGNLEQKKLRKSFIYTTLGIYSSFAIITILLIIFKALGYSLGWGIQFQNIWFLTIMLLVILLFLAQTFDLITFSPPAKLAKIYNIKSENLLSFLTGMFLVLLSTPCTAPYLGTAVGFALTGTYIDICIIIPSIALGLSIPYLLFAAYPKLALLLPPPGKWMHNISYTMSLMLILTIIWLLSIIASQTSITTAIILSICLILILFILWLHKIFINSTYQETISNDVRKKLKKIYTTWALIISLPILTYYFYNSYTSFEKHNTEIALNRKIKFDNIEIRQKIREGKKVLVNIRADWCLTCKFNDIKLLDPQLKEKYNLEIIDIDWTSYDRDILKYMEQFGRKGLPFFVLFSRKIPEGIVLPEILTDTNFVDILDQL